MTQTKSIIIRHYHQLTSEQRGEIEALHDKGYPDAAIARQIHCHRSTVGREVKRGSVRQRDSSYFFYTHYFSQTAQIFHQKRRQKCHRRNLLRRDQFFFKLLTKRIKA